MRVKILHVNVSAICDRFYLKFFDLLKQQGVHQKVVVPYSIQSNSAEDVQYCVTNYHKQLIDVALLPVKKPIDRFLYGKKIRKYTRAVRHEVGIELQNFDVIHAHSLYSDGGVACELHKMCGIPYFVAVRGTDTECFMTYFKWLNPKAREILENAAHVFFISPDLKRKTIEKLYGNRRVVPWLNRHSILPNGVDDFWIRNTYSIGESLGAHENSEIHVIQVSRLIKSKNVDKTILAIKQLRDEGIDVTLTVVGKGSEEARLIQLIKVNCLEDVVDMVGFIENKKDLIELYRKADVFVMPSQGETFGIAYIEALTQSLPIVGLSGAGVSGYLREKGVGEFVETPEPGFIADAIKHIAQNKNELQQKCADVAKEFEWNHIIEQYMRLYTSVL